MSLHKKRASVRTIDVVTGAFSYTGKYIARELLKRGRRIRTLTGHPHRPNPFGTEIEVIPYTFDDPPRLVKALRGADTLYNTYWIRFPKGESTFERAVENTRILFQAAKEAGIRRIVHISITNPSEDSPFPYFRGKALCEKALKATGISYAILRPAVIFGWEDILINNIAWFLRRFPVFGIPGSGQYKVQPIYVEDFAHLAVTLGERETNVVVDAVGPEVLTFEELVRVLRSAVNSRSRLVHVPPRFAWLVTTVVGWAVGDVILTWDEIRALMANLLVSHAPPTGKTRLRTWVKEHGSILGLRYASEIKRHYT